MNLVRQRQWRSVLMALTLLGLCVAPGLAADSVVWDKQRQRVDADIQNWDVRRILKRIAASTRWKIYVEPDTKQVITTRFKNLPEGEALRRLLGDLSFAQVPQTNGPPHLYVFRTSRADATERVKAAESDKAAPIEDELIVKLKPGEKIEDLAKSLGAKVLGRIDGLNAYRLKFDDAAKASQARDSLQGNSAVASVDYNYSIPRPDDPDSAALSAPRMSLQPKATTEGNYITIGLIDSAVQPKEGGFGDFLLTPLSVVGDYTPPSDQPTHGTAMAETILNGLAGVLEKSGSTSVRILPVDVYGENASTTSFEVALGIYKAINAGAQVINLSMASEGDSSVLHDVIKSGYSQGVRFYAAAGNEPVTTVTLPAGWQEVTGVTSVDNSGNYAPYANRGDFVKAGAPGTVLVTFGGASWIVTGTSAATAYASGVAAGVAESTGKPASAVDAAVTRMLPVPKKP